MEGEELWEMMIQHFPQQHLYLKGREGGREGERERERERENGMNEGDKDKINHGQLYACTYTCAEQYHTADRLPIGLSCPGLETCPCS